MTSCRLRALAGGGNPRWLGRGVLSDRGLLARSKAVRRRAFLYERGARCRMVRASVAFEQW